MRYNLIYFFYTFILISRHQYNFTEIPFNLSGISYLTNRMISFSAFDCHWNFYKMLKKQANKEKQKQNKTKQKAKQNRKNKNNNNNNKRAVRVNTKQYQEK